jgi:hypothetical protein
MIDKLLSRLNKVHKSERPNQWTARCPAHDDRSPSLGIRLLDDGRILLHCFSGCSVDAIVASLGMELQDLFPDSSDEGYKPVKSPFDALYALKMIAHEAHIIRETAVLSTITLAELERVDLARERIYEAIRICGGYE